MDETTAQPTETRSKPWPKVVLLDCQTGDEGWEAYDVKTGSVLPNTTPNIAPPYRSTVILIRFENHWGVKEIKVDRSRTCSV
jgi:hypothetical protein